ncbi:hypothetical protein ANMWB30_24700 [Arthrobacter sp. MWB30]|nr:hypothetical protein ANMWB30_24700 [Arthrobacter sp. MWB30]
MQTQSLWLIEASRHFRDEDNYPTHTNTMEIDEGFFTSEERAEERAAELNKTLVDLHQTDERLRKRQHAAAVRQATRHNAEAAAIRAAGMKKADVPIPVTYMPRSFQAFLKGVAYSDEYTIYEVVEIERAASDDQSVAL